MRAAEMNEKEIAGLLQNLLKERLDNMTIFVKHLASNGGLREGMDLLLAAEIVKKKTGSEDYLILTRDQNYSKG